MREKGVPAPRRAQQLVWVASSIGVALMLIISLPVLATPPLDPSVSQQLDGPHPSSISHTFTGSEVADTYLDRDAPSQNFHDANKLSIDQVGRIRPLYYVDLSSVIEPPVIVESAVLTLHILEPYGNKATIRACAHEVLRDWVVSEATWDFASASLDWYEDGCNSTSPPEYADRMAGWVDCRYFDAAALQNGVGIVQFNLTTLVQKWANEPERNHGLILLGNASSRVTWRVASAEHYIPSWKPYLEVTWVPGGPTPTATASATVTSTPSPTLTPTPTLTPSASPTPTLTTSPSPTPTETGVPSPTPTDTATPTPTPTETAGPSPTPTTPTPAPLHLPLICRQYCPPTIVVWNGGFEDGVFGCWEHGGDLAQRVTGRLHNGDYPTSGSFCAQLGEPVECEEHPAASTWMYYTVYVPNSASGPPPTVSFRYRIFTNDILDWSSFRVEIRDQSNVTLEQILRDGYDPPDRVNICYNDLGWRSSMHDLSPYKGMAIRLWFDTRNEFTGGLGTWTYVDDVLFASETSRDLCAVTRP